MKKISYLILLTVFEMIQISNAQNSITTQNAPQYSQQQTPDIQQTVITMPNIVTNAACSNMGFEQYNFSGWTGDYGTVSAGISSPYYTITGSTILNPAGNNTMLQNTSNYHTIMSIPAISNVYPYCYGYDSMACKTVGTSTISQIPVVSPFSFDGASVRMNGLSANQRACRLKYITTTSSANKHFSFSYAVVFQNPAGHVIGEAPYFKVEVRNETTNTLLPGCSSFTINSISLAPEDSLFQSSTGSSVDPTVYRKWQHYSVDLSALPLGTSVSVSFEVGGCTMGGHWGYAYVDAECGGNPSPYCNMCAGSTMATLVAPPGFASYQWLDPSGAILTGSTNDSLLVNPAIPGNVYSVQMVSMAGCTVTMTDTVKLTTISIINLNTSASCSDGHSGSAFVLPSGGTGSYTYQWTITSGPSTGSVVSTSQLATGLAPGNYSISVSSASCGQASATVIVDNASPFFITKSKGFCGNRSLIAEAGGTNYKWYKSGVSVAAPNGTNDTIQILSPQNGDIYTLVFTNASGCKDSTAYVLGLVSGGSTYLSSLQNVCAGNATGSAIINLNTTMPGPYSYLVTGPGNSVVTNVTATGATSYTIAGLVAGDYSWTINDGICLYSDTLTIDTVKTGFNIHPTSSILCSPSDAAVLQMNFDGVTPSACATDPILCSGGGVPMALFTAASFTQNGFNTYPSPYGNWYTYGRSQFLVRKSDLNAAGITGGRISSLAFNVLNMNISTTNYPNFSIKMGCTSLAALPSVTPTAVPFTPGLQTVYSQANQPVAVGWVTHNFSESYLWDGNSNIIVEVCFGMNTPSSWTNNVSVELKQMSYIASTYHVEDGGTVCSGTQLADDNASTMTNGKYMLPNMKFGYCSYGSAPAAYTVSVSSNGTITANYGNDSLKVAPVIIPATTPATVVYTVTAINPDGGCVATKTVSVLYASSQVSVTATAASATVCEGSLAHVSATGAVFYDWSFLQSGVLVPLGNTASLDVAPAAGTNTYVVTGSSPCNSGVTDTKTITVYKDPACADVWPGDANSDGIADNLDVLELGLHYTQTGASRPSGVSNNWQSYFSTNWIGNITNGQNLNHSDCNGDGMIDANDTLAIYTNYGLTHAFKESAQTTADPQLSIVPDQSLVAKGTWGTSSIYLGTSTLALNAVNGVAFTVYIDQTLIEPGSMYVDYPISFLNGSNHNLHFRKSDFSNGLIYTATTHTTNSNVNGNGKIAILHYKIKSTLVHDTILNMHLIQAFQSSANGSLTPLTAGSASVTAIGATVGINEMSGNNMVAIYPNPATNVLTVTSTAELQKVELVSVTGQVVISEFTSGNQHQLDVNSVSNGVYVVTVYSRNNSIQRKKIVVQH